jgi:hypothetical protein
MFSGPATAPVTIAEGLAGAGLTDPPSKNATG